MKEYKVTITDGTTRWFNKEGKLHREDGPAIEFANGGKAWRRNGRLHREDGPAVEYSNGEKVWYIDGVQLTEEEFNERTKTVELTLEEIANKFKVDINNLKIKNERI